MTRIIITHVDGVMIAKMDAGARAAQSYVRKIKRDGFEHKGTHYGPAAIVKIEIKDNENGKA